MDGPRPRPSEAEPTMRVAKHPQPITCPWCNAGATMTFADARGEYCMACKRHLCTGEAMHSSTSK